MPTTLRSVLDEADHRKVAIGHFNISDLVAMKAISGAARELHVPVLVGLSEGERDFMGVRQAVALVHSLRDRDDYPIFLNADHTHSLAKAVDAAKAGFDAISFDGSQLPFDENVTQTKHAVEAIKTINPSIIVEGEIGDIGSGSEIHETIPEVSKTLTTPEQAKQFVDATGIDVLAPAVGNMHGLLRGMIRGEEKKHLQIQRVLDIKKATGIFMTLHGGSGTDDEDFKSAIKAGITIVHVSTEMRLAWRQGLEAALAKAPDEVVPYKILREALEAVKNVVRARLQLFNHE
jgi:fructose-bisphosphate aldolase class II